MQRTEKYFEQDAFRTQCESIILAAEPDEKTGGGRIALDGTVFYPEGGGQPADRGTLTLPDGATLNVTDVHEHDGILWHSVPSLPDTAVPESTLTLKNLGHPPLHEQFSLLRPIPDSSGAGPAT